MKKILAFVVSALLIVSISVLSLAAQQNVVVPMDFTLKENQSDNVNDTVYIYYCLYACDHLRPQMAVSEFEQFMDNKHLYYIRSEKIVNSDGQAMHSYFFLENLELRVQGDPINAAEIIMSCPQHPETKIALSFSILYSSANREENMIFMEDMENQLKRRMGRAEPDDTYRESVQQSLSETCLEQLHFIRYKEQLVLLRCLWRASNFYAGMPRRQLESLIPPSEIKTDISNDLLYGYRKLFADSSIVWECQFSEERLVYTAVGITPPICKDLLVSPYVWDKNSRDHDPFVSYTYGISSPEIIVELETNDE